ncbi:hypothetical protein [Novosphingobium aquimarinum]|uniref:hypothetical protein n=1 Tax=Novosphingobium aquimarinum TaxID=2682494 RepID=UPI0012EB737E|nr:hypothetical protein [Novosphingobium aquimarinum]
MATNLSSGALQAGREFRTDHESFLQHRSFRWLKLSSLLMLVCIAAYFLIDVEPRPNGGTWVGYTLGTIGAGLIVWLSLLGFRKRAITEGGWSLKAWTSAHVYLGLSLIVIATLHTGFQLGWNVHTLAYALMMLVIVSGIVGIWFYSTIPAELSLNRREMTQRQMLEGLKALDRQLNEAAQPLPRDQADTVLAALGDSPFSAGFWRRTFNYYPGCKTTRAIAVFDDVPASDKDAKRVQRLLMRRKGQLERIRRHMKLKALLESWLFVHVPATLALIAALAAHIVSVFFYW